MSFKTLLVAVLTLVACKTPAHRSQSSVQGLADDIDVDSNASLACKPIAGKPAVWQLIDVKTNQVWLSEKFKLGAADCIFARDASGPGGACLWESEGLLGLYRRNTRLQYWITVHVPVETAFRECVRSAKRQDGPDTYGHQGLICEKDPGGKNYRLATRDSVLAVNLSLSACENSATNARNGLVCAYRPIPDASYNWVVRQIDSNAVLVGEERGVSQNHCEDIVRTSGPSGICYFTSKTNSLVFQNGQKVLKSWPGTNINSTEEIKACLQLAQASSASETTPEAQPLPVTGSQTLAGVVSRNPAFRPGTSQTELFVVVNGAEIAVLVSNATRIELGQGRDLSQLVGVPVRIEGLRSERGAVSATAIVEVR